MLTEYQAKMLVLKYIKSTVTRYHRAYRQELTDKYDDVFKYFPNKTSVNLYRGYTFRSEDSNTFYKKLLESVKSRLSMTFASSWSSDLDIAAGFFDNTYSDYNDYALLIQAKVKANSCIDVSKARKNSPSTLNDESEYILPPVLPVHVNLIAVYSNREDIYWCLPKYRTFMKSTRVKNVEYIPSFLDFLDTLTCLTESQKYTLYTHALNNKDVF